jgi:hypothetical protein
MEQAPLSSLAMLVHRFSLQRVSPQQRGVVEHQLRKAETVATPTSISKGQDPPAVFLHPCKLGYQRSK